MVAASKCDAFISYARADSAGVAPLLHHAIERFAKRWNQLRAVRIFRDDDSMSVNAGLWSSIEEALQQSRYFILIASPAAASSDYVDREAAWWLRHKSSDTVLLALHKGELRWNQQHGRFSSDSVLPPSMLTAFSEEPRWADLRWIDDVNGLLPHDSRFDSAVADLAAPIRGIDRDELFGENVVQHRRLRRLARAAITGLVGLLVAALVLAAIAVLQRNDVLRQARSLLSRQLSTTAVGLLASDLRTAGQLAGQAVLTEDTPLSRATLTQTMLASPHLQHFIPMGGDITAMTASGDGRVVVAALSDGRIMSSSVDGLPKTLCTVPGGVTDVRSDRSGRTVVVRAGERITICTPDAMPRQLQTPVGAAPQAIAVSPSGRRIAATFTFLDAEVTAKVQVFDGNSVNPMLSIGDPLYNPAGDYLHLSDALVLQSDSRLTLVSQSAFWYTLDLRTRRLSREDGVDDWSPDRYGYSMTGSGDFVMRWAAKNGDEVAIWPMNRAASAQAPYLANLRMTDVRRMTTNRKGTHVLVDDSTGLFLARVHARARSAGNELATRLSGVGATSGMQFLADTGLFATSSGQAVAIWRIDSSSHSRQARSLKPRATCTFEPYSDDCRSSTLALSSGSRVAVVDNHRLTLEILPAPGQADRRTTIDLPPDLKSSEIPDLESPKIRYVPVWIDDNRLLLVTNGSPAAHTMPPTAAVSILSLKSDSLILGAQMVSPTQLLVSFDDGRLQWVNSDSGAAERTTLLPIQIDADNSLDGSAFSADRTRVVVWRAATYLPKTESFGPGAVWVVNTRTGEIVATVGNEGTVLGATLGPNSLAIHYGGNNVDLIQANGAGARVRLRTAGDNPSSTVGQQTPMVAGGELIGIPQEHSIQLVNQLGQTVGTVVAEDTNLSTPRSYALTPDGDQLLIGSYGTTPGTATVATVDLDPTQQVRNVCRTSGGPIALTDWDRLIGAEVPRPRLCE